MKRDRLSLLTAVSPRDDSVPTARRLSSPSLRRMDRHTVARSLLILFGVAAPLAAQVHPASPGSMHQHHAATDSTGVGLFLHARPEAYLLTEQLRRGGMIVVMRHGKTDVNGVDVLPPDYRSCARQRNLSPSGRSTTREVAESWRYLGVRVASAIASPYCRVIETATALFPKAATSELLAVTPPGDGAGARLLGVVRSQRPPAGSNALIVGHVISMLQAFDVKLQEGESLVLEPNAQGGPPRVLGRITATEWGDVHRDTKAHGVAMVTRAATAQLRPPPRTP
jgi:phosphohistidine phosphatase SixA